MALKPKYKEQLLAIIHKHVPGCAVYLFGSRAINAEQLGSDIDIAIDYGVPVDFKKILKILCDIDETTIPLMVDIVDIQTAPDELKEAIFQEGIKWTN